MDYAKDGALARMFPKASVELKFGIERRSFPLVAEDSSDGGILYRNEWIELRGEMQSLPDGSRYRLHLRSLSRKSIRITRLRFPAEGGIGPFLEGFHPTRVAFLRNGYQSWSTARSYRISEKPLRPRLGLVSLATSNMANLPSNTAGELSSERYSVITDLTDGSSMLVGQEPPFDQFFYIALNVDKRGGSFFELSYDFGRQMMNPGERLDLDGIVFLYGTRPKVEQSYFHMIREETGYKAPTSNLRGWCSWYQYYDRITPDILYRNLEALKRRGLGFDFFQIDDGWQAAVGDWLEQSPPFKGRMKELADAIRAAGMRPGLWFAPFAAASDSELFRLHPEYVLKTEYGRFLKAGYNPIWKGYYYGLDATHPRYAEYLREVVHTIVDEWGFDYLKCDFLFSACLRGGAHHELAISRSRILKEGMALIREEAGREAVIIGCGMPISAGIGMVDAMRVGPDTGDFWIKLAGKLLRTGAMVGARNSIRNFMVRSPMHKRLWLNDPDCVMIRDTDTRLKDPERYAQMDAIALSGGILMYSDDFSRLSERAFRDMALIDEVSDACFQGQAIAVDVMEKELPEIYYNTSGHVGFFNFRGRARRRFDLGRLRDYEPGLSALLDLRTGERLRPSGGVLDLGLMPRHGSRLFRIERGV
ncbi:MAG TPA: glycoside hydrolase family 36 protein [Rectinemataceae bacterium]|nr:glycoside hydrolase family 36 protein [Rectinemataceae bacterium]